MTDFFRIGGYGMWPTLAFGLLMFAAALRYAGRPERKRVPLVVSLGVLTLASGLCGFITGLIKSFEAVGQVGPDDRFIAIIGLGESLHNVALALICIALATLAAVVGAYRMSRAPAAT
jgi:hypothetical protein